MTSPNQGVTGSHVCPWWFAYTFDNILRRLIHDPEQIAGPFVTEGMTVLDVGCGMGHFSIGMARLVGTRGRVFALDLQAQMLEVLARRAAKAGVADRITTQTCPPDSLGLETPVDFALAFWMVHETPDAETFLRQVATILRDGGRLLVAEPALHVNAGTFTHILECAGRGGLAHIGTPSVRFSRAALFRQA